MPQSEQPYTAGLSNTPDGKESRTETTLGTFSWRDGTIAKCVEGLGYKP